MQSSLIYSLTNISYNKTISKGLKNA